jgi:hypothetical protein
MSVELILKELPTLSASELQTVKAHIDFLTKNIKSTDSSIRITLPKRSNLKNVIHLCAKRFISVADISFIERTNSRNLDDKMEEIAQSIEQVGKILSLDRKQVMKLCQILVEASVEKIKSLNYNLNFSTMLTFMENPMELLDESYPGYVSTSMFKTMVLS